MISFFSSPESTSDVHCNWSWVDLVDGDGVLC